MVHWSANRLKSYLIIFCCGLIVGTCISYLFIIFAKIQNSAEIAVIPGKQSNAYSQNFNITELMSKKVRILCMIYTSGDPINQQKAIFIRNTWAKRCNKFLFMSDNAMNNSSLFSTVNLNSYDSEFHLWSKMQISFKYVYTNFLNDYDWFMKAYDDTYVVVENLRYFLLPYDPNVPVFHSNVFNLRENGIDEYGFQTGGAGFVLSRKALQLFVEVGMNNSMICDGRFFQFEEDMEIMRCLLNLGVNMSDSRDKKNRQRFMPSHPEDHFIDGSGSNCCSDIAISFNYVSIETMTIMEYLIYNFKPFGIIPNFVLSIESLVKDSRHIDDEKLLEYIIKLSEDDSIPEQ